MPNFYLSPNMSLVVPVPSVDPGPDWASNINASLTILDGHTHSPGSGVQVTPSGLNINSDLAFGANNATVVRSVRFSPNLAALSLPADIGAVYEAGVDLYYNDGNGNQIRITQSGSLAGAAGTITGLPNGTASASYQSSSGTFVFQQATSTGANLDVASIVVRYPGSYPTPSGNYIILEAPSSLASGYALVLPALPAQTNVMTLGVSGIIASTTWNAVGQNMTSVGADAIGVSMSAVGSQAIAASMTTAGSNQIISAVTVIPIGFANLSLNNINSVSAATANLIVGSATIISAATANMVGVAMTSAGANAVAATVTASGADILAGTMTSTGANAIAGDITSIAASPANVIAAARTRAVSSAAGIGGVAFSAFSSGVFSTTSATFVTVTNQSITIATSGRPVFVSVIPDASATDSFITGGGFTRVRFLRDGATTLGQGVVIASTVQSNFFVIDNVGAGTHSYDFQINTTSSAQVSFVQLVVYEL